MIEGKRILITGGAGFIGSALAERLVGANRVVIFDDFSRDSLSGREFRGHKNLRVIKGDVLDRDDLSTTGGQAQC